MCGIKYASFWAKSVYFPSKHFTSHGSCLANKLKEGIAQRRRATLLHNFCLQGHFWSFFYMYLALVASVVLGEFHHGQDLWHVTCGSKTLFPTLLRLMPLWFKKTNMWVSKSPKHIYSALLWLFTKNILRA